ncbi:MAG: reverse transcriptase domain-containing protein [Candidatus Thiodiazotropha taylori]|nr:hypothetical protein [Candidatus Thiodiazotropha taylori]MCW4286068.1 reverse transcriptase domain-containing protein [Candidatus Thiodiazotropha taylori]
MKSQVGTCSLPFNLVNTTENFVAGKTQLFKENWFKLTKDPWIRDTIMGYRVELESKPVQTFQPKPLKFSEREQKEIDKEINRFLSCKIIEPVEVTELDEFISNIFFRTKKDGKIRIILNLKNFNKDYLEKQHFKMETLQAAVSAMRKGCFFGSVDLAEAFYSVPISVQDRKYFRFWHRNQKYQFTALIMGLTHSPRIFTKILKPVFAHLRGWGHHSAAYIDDSCLQGSTYQKCLSNIHDTVQLMDSLGLTIQLTKSVLQPTKQIVFLGFVLCSETMSVRPSPERCQAIINLCHDILAQKRITIRQFAKLIGKLVATEPGVEYAPLYYKPLEKVKEKELNSHLGNFDSFMSVTNEITPTIQWWIKNLKTSHKLISHGPPKVILYSDSSTKGWGAFNQTHDIRTGGEWSVEEQECHINILELKACFFALKSFCKDLRDIHIKVFMDNTTSCCYVAKFGGKSEDLNSLAREIWMWCIERNIHLTVSHVPGVENNEADQESRKINDDTEWSLSPPVFAAIKELHPHLSIDLFASRNNKKLNRYVARRPDPGAYAIDAFSMTWTNHLFYIFPPFSLIGKVLQKIQEDQSQAVLVAPIWTTQSWWPSLLDLISGECFQVQNTRKNLYLPHNQTKKYPLRKMNLGVFYISGKSSNGEEFHKDQETLSYNHGEVAPRNNITRTLRSGLTSVRERELIPLNPRLRTC